MKSRFLILPILLVLSFSAKVSALDEHVVMVRAVSVPDRWMTFQDVGGWDFAAPIKESKYAKYYEVTIWEEIKAIHLYAFSNEYSADPNWLKLTPEYRESFLVQKFENIPDGGSNEQNGARSLFLKNAMLGFLETITERHPESEYSFTYNGHGASGGAIMELQISPRHTHELFRDWKKMIGKNLAFVDMGGPCSKSGFSDLATFCPFTDYYIASDLPNGGYQFDNWSEEAWDSYHIERQWHSIFESSNSMIEALEKRIDLMRAQYLGAKNYMIEHKLKQANYLHSCSAFNAFSPLYAEQVKASGASLVGTLETDEFGRSLLPKNTSWDLRKSVLASGNQTLLEALEKVTVYQADNRDFFEWEEDRAGISTPNSIMYYGSAVNLDMNSWKFEPVESTSHYNGVVPDASLGLTLNNIGNFSSADSTIYSCMRLTTDALTSSANGVSRFDVELKVVSLSEATAQLINFKEFNAEGALNPNAERPDCSGRFETTTGVYTDIIQAGASTLDATWQLIDPTNFLFRLVDFSELAAD